MAEIRTNVKTVLDIQDVAQDAVLDILIRNVQNHLKGMLKRVNKNITEIPEELTYVVEEIVIRRYNRIGSEGMKSESVEIIDDYREEDPNAGRGRVLFI